MKLHCLYLCMAAMAFAGCGEDGERRSLGGKEGTQGMVEEREPVVNSMAERPRITGEGLQEEGTYEK